MPIYTYKCKNCGIVFEKMKPMSSNGTEKCSDCRCEALRVFSPAGLIFKGSGFYTTDYKSGSNKANINKSGTKEEKAGPEKSAAGTNGSSEKPVKEKTPGSTADKNAAEKVKS